MPGRPSIDLIALELMNGLEVNMSIPANKVQEMVEQIKKNSRLGAPNDDAKRIAPLKDSDSRLFTWYKTNASIIASIPADTRTVFEMSPVQASGLPLSPVFSGLMSPSESAMTAYNNATDRQEAILKNLLISQSNHPIRLIKTPTFAELVGFGAKLSMGALKILLGWDETPAEPGVLNRKALDDIKPEGHIAAMSKELAKEKIGLSDQTLLAFKDQARVTNLLKELSNDPEALLSDKERQELLDLGPDEEKTIAKDFSKDYDNFLASAQAKAEKQGCTPQECAEIRKNLIAMKLGVIAHEGLACLRAVLQSSHSTSANIEYVKGLMTNDPEVMNAEPGENTLGKYLDGGDAHNVEPVCERMKTQLQDMKDTAKTDESTTEKDMVDPGDRSNVNR